MYFTPFYAHKIRETWLVGNNNGVPMAIVWGYIYIWESQNNMPKSKSDKKFVTSRRKWEEACGNTLYKTEFQSNIRQITKKSQFCSWWPQ